jgi:hypothetical protein
MSEIARSGKNNLAGGRWMEVALAIGLTVAGTLKPGFSWTRIYCSLDTLGYEYKTDRVDNGLTYTHDIKGFSPNDAPAKAAALDQLVTYERVVCRFCDNMGVIRLIGTTDQPLFFSYQFGTDTSVPGSRGYQIAIAGTTTTAPVYE